MSYTNKIDPKYIMYQLSHSAMQDLINLVGNMPWVNADPIMKIIKSEVKEVILPKDETFSSQLPILEE